MDILLSHVIGVARWAPAAAKEAAITRVLDQKTNQPILLLTCLALSYDLHDISEVVVYACSERILQLGRSSCFQLSAKGHFVMRDHNAHALGQRNSVCMQGSQG